MGEFLMTLDIPNVFASGLFQNSYEDNQTLVYAGNRWIPTYLVNYRGDWATARNYNINDSVYNDGATYICILAHASQEPPNATYWAVMAAQGSDGATGSDGAAGTDGADGQGYEFLINDTFDNIISAAVWDNGYGGGGSAISSGSGVLGCAAENTDGGYAYIISVSSWTMTSYPYLVIEFDSLFEHDYTNTANEFIGLMTASDEVGDIADCVGVYHDSSGYQAQLVTKKDGTDTKSAYYATGIYSDNYCHHRLEISKEAVKWFVNGVLAATNTTNIPDDATLKLLVRADCVGEAGTGDDNRVRVRNITLWNDRN